MKEKAKNMTRMLRGKILLCSQNILVIGCSKNIKLTVRTTTCRSRKPRKYKKLLYRLFGTFPLIKLNIG